MKRSRSNQIFRTACAIFTASLLCAGAWAKAPVAPAPELLEAEKAFQSTARVKDGKAIEIEFKIADGYYMYRKRFQFASAAESLKLGKAQTPAGKLKQDATFGRVETYRKSVRLLLPYTSSDKELRFKVISQGCADAGVCYPPLKQEFVVKAGDTMAVSALAPEGAPPGAKTPAPGSIADLIKKAP
jgi:thioredoxin:protein disulfide reductase